MSMVVMVMVTFSRRTLSVQHLVTSDAGVFATGTVAPGMMMVMVATSVVATMVMR